MKRVLRRIKLKVETSSNLFEGLLVTGVLVVILVLGSLFVAGC